MLVDSSGKNIANAAVSDSVAGLAVLDPSIVTDTTKQRSIVKAEYLENQKVVYTDSSAPFALDTTVLPNGEHTITERITYNDGSRSETTSTILINNTKNTGSKATGMTAVLAATLTIGVPLVVVALAVAAAIWWWRRRKLGNTTEMNAIERMNRY
jgi:hypothetical protein